MNSARTVAFLIVASLVVGLVVSVMRRGIEVNGHSAAVVVAPIASTQQPRTKIDVIKGFLQEKWPFVEAKLTPEQLASLSEPCSPEGCPPWTEVEPLIRAQIREGLQKQREEWIHRFRDKGWPKDLTAQPLNPMGRQLGLPELQQIQTKVDASNLELEPLAALAFDLLVETEEAIWDQRLFEACPFVETTLSGTKERHAQFVILAKWKQGPWAVSYIVDSSEWPMLDAVLTEMAGIAKRRDGAIQDYIASI